MEGQWSLEQPKDVGLNGDLGLVLKVITFLTDKGDTRQRDTQKLSLVYYLPYLIPFQHEEKYIAKQNNSLIILSNKR